ncbi:MAG TPA: hypothetical protein DCZ72_10890 [Armatimonadetes bacterium]|nr:hypothetical protein [Armatimonadota bacterium]
MDQDKNAPTAVPTTERQPAPRRPYEPPHAEFVPLRVEERLMACLKTPLDRHCASDVLLMS